MTGFPGFLGSALLPRLLARREGVRAVCVVQPQHRTTAQRRLDDLDRAHPGTAARVRLVEGDLTLPGLGLDPGGDRTLADVEEVWHLAAVYDLAVPEAVARRVNVDGTAHVLDLCRTLRRGPRLQHVSTCFVSGRFTGAFTEDALDEGQTFYNHYEATKFEAEVLVRDAMADGLPATVYRPGIVVGDSRTGRTQKYDGPYYVAALLRRQPGVAVLPAVRDDVVTSLVPRDFVVDAMDHLSVLDRSVGRTYALTDPRPPTARRVAEVFAAHLGKRIVWVPLPIGLTRTALATVPGLSWLLGLPPQTLDYFTTATTYPTTNTTADLAGSGVECPDFASYAGVLLDFMAEHPEVGSAAMV